MYPLTNFHAHLHTHIMTYTKEMPMGSTSLTPIQGISAGAPVPYSGATSQCRQSCTHSTKQEQVDSGETETEAGTGKTSRKWSR